jgi:hypothetical protein
MNDTLNDSPQKRKRGRPRKSAIVSSEKKKRGRKPLDKVVTPAELPVDNEIILQLPITKDEIAQFKTGVKKVVTTQHSINKNVFKVINNDMFTLSDISNISSDDSDNMKKFDGSTNELNKLLKTKDDTIRKLTSELEDMKKQESDSNIKVNFKNVKSIDLELVKVEDGTTIIQEKTDICCWWCTHEFDNLPCFIPDRYYDDKYYVFGCFCSYSCATAYNINMNDYKVWDRYSLIKVLYNYIYDTTDDIIMAPPKEVLKRYGGLLSIDEYRENSSNYVKKHRLIIPPMVSIVSQIEESSVNNYNIATSKYKPNSEPSSSGYRLERSKPLPNIHTTLIESMGLKQTKIVR